MNHYKIISFSFLFVSTIFISLFCGAMITEYNLLEFDFVALNFSTTQGMWDRIDLAFSELRKSHVLISVQYNVLPVCMLLNAIFYVVAFLINIGRWHNLLPYCIQITAMSVITQLAYALTLNAHADLMLFIIAGIFTALCAGFYVMVLLSFPCVKIINPLRRGFLVLAFGMLVCFKEHLFDVQHCHLFSEMFDVVFVCIVMEIAIDILNLVEKIGQDD